MPGKGRPFPKGVSGNPGGRPKVLGDVQELARQKSPEAITTLANIMQNPTHSILAATHNVEFAERWGRRVRNETARRPRVGH
jgi:hypothetical protein